MEKTYKKYGALKENVGKKCTILESAIAGMKGRVGVIEDVIGDDVAGYRYEVVFDSSNLIATEGARLYDNSLYPPTFNVKIEGT